MARRSEYVEHVLELMRGFGAVQAKPMFGGWGLWRDGLFFAIVAWDVLYFKVDEENRAAFEAAGLEPFVFETKDGRRTVLSYRAAPEEALESPVVMAEWARLGYEAALRAANAPARTVPAGPKKKPPRKPKRSAAGEKAPRKRRAREGAA
jgi:DNA transformation protein and related proteins